MSKKNQFSKPKVRAPTGNFNTGERVIGDTEYNRRKTNAETESIIDYEGIENFNLSLEEKAHYIHHSNSVEGINLGLDTTYEILENPDKFKHFNFKILDVGDFSANVVLDHEKALNYILNLSTNESITENIIKKAHFLLMQNIMPSDYKAGEYRTKSISVGKKKISDEYTEKYIAPDSKKVPEYMTHLEDMILDLEVKSQVTEQDCWTIHDEFETIHPFIDGNGRTGRLLLNALLLKYNFSTHIVLMEDKDKYFQKIRVHGKERNIGKFVKEKIPTQEDKFLALYLAMEQDQQK